MCLLCEFSFETVEGLFEECMLKLQHFEMGNVNIYHRYRIGIISQGTCPNLHEFEIIDCHILVENGPFLNKLIDPKFNVYSNLKKIEGLCPSAKLLRLKICSFYKIKSGKCWKL